MTIFVKLVVLIDYDGDFEHQNPWELLSFEGGVCDKKLLIEPFIETCLGKALAAILKEKSPKANLFEISCLLTDDEKMHVLNKEYRDKDKPTNVLSFGDIAAPLAFGPDKNGQADSHPIILGDLVLSYDTIAKEAKEQQKSFQNHFTHLLVHGLLHLLGYDHEQEEDADLMENLERKLLQGFGLPDPYEPSTAEV